ncbi:MAG: 4-diphosphocytidyl-2-C-methyl-D-erythritol kinase [Planctomycetota bacterium]|jgi:4-diphosphocytidyl-2-C-methyl-D-erythritol kinase
MSECDATAGAVGGGCGWRAVSGERLVVQSASKLNIFLEVLGRREDGYHELDTVMVRTRFCDTLTLIPDFSGSVRLRFSDSTPVALRSAVPLDGRNLILRAAEQLRGLGDSGCGAEIILHKCIPPESGLGGGSGNAAAALLGCRQIWKLSVSDERLHEIAAGLGSDINFLLSGVRAAVCRGRGEQIQPLPLSGSLYFVAVRPGRGNSTAEVFRRTSAGTERRTSAEVARCLTEGRADLLESCIFNRLTESAAGLNSEMADLQIRFQHAVGKPVFMSGSGSTVFAVCRSAREAREVRQTVERKLRVVAWSLEV